jgi:hypothetical protein
VNDVSLGELARRIDEVLRTVRDLPGRGEYTEYRQHVEHRFTDIERDVADERDARKEADKALADRLDKAGTNWRQVLYQGLFPGIAIIITAANLWISSRGGS